MSIINQILLSENLIQKEQIFNTNVVIDDKLRSLFTQNKLKYLFKLVRISEINQKNLGIDFKFVEINKNLFINKEFFLLETKYGIIKNLFNRGYFYLIVSENFNNILHSILKTKVYFQHNQRVFTYIHENFINYLIKEIGSFLDKNESQQKIINFIELTIDNICYFIEKLLHYFLFIKENDKDKILEIFLNKKSYLTYLSLNKEQKEFVFRKCHFLTSDMEVSEYSSHTQNEISCFKEGFFKFKDLDLINKTNSLYELFKNNIDFEIEIKDHFFNLELPQTDIFYDKKIFKKLSKNKVFSKNLSIIDKNIYYKEKGVEIRSLNSFSEIYRILGHEYDYNLRFGDDAIDVKDSALFFLSFKKVKLFFTTHYEHFEREKDIEEKEQLLVIYLKSNRPVSSLTTSFYKKIVFNMFEQLYDNGILKNNIYLDNDAYF